LPEKPLISSTSGEKKLDDKRRQYDEGWKHVQIDHSHHHHHRPLHNPFREIQSTGGESLLPEKPIISSTSGEKKLDEKRRHTTKVGSMSKLITSEGDKDSTSLHDAINKRDLGAMLRMLGEGAPKDEVNKFGQTPLFVAAENGLMEMVRHLVIRRRSPAAMVVLLCMVVLYAVTWRWWSTCWSKGRRRDKVLIGGSTAVC
jgi:hypothetical protein